MKIPARSRLLLGGLGVLVLFLALKAGAQVYSGGALSLIGPFFAAGGGGSALSAGPVSLTHSIGEAAVTPMSGGTFTLSPGIIAETAPVRNDLGSLHAFPTPFKPSLGHDRITFRGLTGHVTIRIYTLSGELVTTLSKDDPTTGDFVWYPVVNAQGSALASGVYFYAVHDEDGLGNARGKIMIIK